MGDLVPRYGMLDGTWIVSVLLPLYFGVVNGDVGMGLVMLAIVLVAGVALRSRPKARLVTGVLGRAAVVAIVFGFLYGEFFDRSFGPVPLNRVETVAGFATVAAVFLTAQLTANLAVGVMRSTGERRRGDAWAPAAHFAVFAGATFVAFAIASLLGSLLTNAVEATTTWLAVAEVPDGVGARHLLPAGSALCGRRGASRRCRDGADRRLAKHRQLPTPASRRTGKHTECPRLWREASPCSRSFATSRSRAT